MSKLVLVVWEFHDRRAWGVNLFQCSLGCRGPDSGTGQLSVVDTTNPLTRCRQHLEWRLDMRISCLHLLGLESTDALPCGADCSPGFRVKALSRVSGSSTRTENVGLAVEDTYVGVNSPSAYVKPHVWVITLQSAITFVS
jgi:hypothetical protein